jgi:hypothetical protein
MNGSLNWDWDTEEKLITDTNEWKDKFPIIHEFVVSNDGEKISAIVEIENKKVTPCINGKTWETTYERVWSPLFIPDNRLICSVLQNYEWTVAIDENLWEEKYDFVWNMTFNHDGKDIAVNIKKDNEYGISLNGTSWNNRFVEARDVILSPNGKRTATRVKTKRIATLDIFSFAEKVLTIAVDGNAWDKKFLGLWGIAFSSDSTKIAAGVKLDHLEFTIAVDGNPWEETFLQVWEPIFKPGNNDVVAPVKTADGWTLAMNGKLMWDR